MSDVIISTAHVVILIVMFNTKVDDFNQCKFEMSTIYDLFEDVICKQNELR